MTNGAQAVELDIRRKSQELAVAWRKGKAAFVLQSLGTEEPLRAALIATFIHDALARWDPYDTRWPNGFRQALLVSSQGQITAEELAELERDYRRQFGVSPPDLPTAEQGDDDYRAQTLMFQVRRIRSALETGEPIIRERDQQPEMFLRPQTARR